MQLIDVKGIGNVSASNLKSLGINSVIDLLTYIPSKYFDLSEVTKIKHAIVGDYVLIRAFVKNPVKVSFITKSYKIIKNYLVDDTGVIEVNWFNMPYITNSIKEGIEYFFFGKVTEKNNKKYLVNPKIDDIENPKRYKGILPIYRTKGLIPQSTFYSYIKNAIDVMDKVDIFSISSKNRENYIDNIKKMHVCDTMLDAERAIDNVIAEDVARAIVAIRRNRVKGGIESIDVDKVKLEAFINNLEFKLTKTQKETIYDIYNDLKSDTSMNRAISGDVGSGKTIVAIAAIYMVSVLANRQSIIIAPTEILAFQHLSTIKKVLHSYLKDNEIEILTSSVKGKSAILKRLKNGEIKVLVATHAAYSKNVEYENLSLVVVDESHRFGVKQRSKFENKSKQVNTLIMSATHIPRAIALMLTNELKVSDIERREGTYNIKTKVVDYNKLLDVINFIKKEARDGKKSYIVCPRIIDTEGIEMASIENIYKTMLSNGIKEDEIGLLHGKITSQEKDETLDKFKNGNLNILLATTVVEVGIDVQNATYMFILNAEFFGLATLHQLRGRVGRSTEQGYCFLLTYDENNERLRALERISDGKELAQIDAEFRGYGDFFGFNQSGRPSFKISKTALVLAKQIADDVDIDALELSALAMEFLDKFKELALN